MVAAFPSALGYVRSFVHFARTSWNYLCVRKHTRSHVRLQKRIKKGKKKKERSQGHKPSACATLRYTRKAKLRTARLPHSIFIEPLAGISAAQTRILEQTMQHQNELGYPPSRSHHVSLGPETPPLYFFKVSFLFQKSAARLHGMRPGTVCEETRIDRLP